MDKGKPARSILHSPAPTRCSRTQGTQKAKGGINSTKKNDEGEKKIENKSKQTHTHTYKSTQKNNKNNNNNNENRKKRNSCRDETFPSPIRPLSHAKWWWNGLVRDCGTVSCQLKTRLFVSSVSSKFMPSVCHLSVKLRLFVGSLS